MLLLLHTHASLRFVSTRKYSQGLIMGDFNLPSIYKYLLEVKGNNPTSLHYIATADLLTVLR